VLDVQVFVCPLERDRVAAPEAEEAKSKDALSVEQMAQNFADGPFAGGVTNIDAGRRNSCDEIARFVELAR
jgi:hypothetical protein